MATADGFAKLGRTYNTPSLALQSNIGSIYAISNEIGKDTLKDLLFAHITELNVFLNQQNHMTTEQVAFIVDELMDDECFKWLNLAELALIIRRIKTSFYGKLYNNFDSCKFFEILRDYDTERTQAIEQLRIKEASQYKGATIKRIDYSKFKINAERECNEKRQANIRREEDIALKREKIGKITMKAKEMVDAMGITDEKEYKKAYDDVFCKLLENK